ncbi:phosphonate ABC transporter ATP-binding protein [Desulfobacula phenolica]|uniref:Phosphonate transport system ATP-binding protein n=1 Tax=Desulfobacula phenolica TaxID=90732 RepID=A0A1H2H2H6_9BACT|nr:phosphonate ABC transporter ATP-binding protein [Desulfobacula phenolica]SDU26067.1 phosphonate transport system ATP-binding protein [Desulfobacula phenolica]
MEQESQPVLQVNNLTKIYPGNIKAVNDVSFQVKKGEMVAVLGPSGAGKSTLLRCMNRLINKSTGQVLVNGKDITQCRGQALRRLRSDVGMIFQQFNLIPRLTVFENVLAGRLSHTSNPFWCTASIFRFFNETNKQKAFDALKRVGIEHLAPKRSDSLSGGQQQRVAIARTLAQEPEVILADEPVASLDPASSQRVLGILKQISESKNIPVIVNLHQVDLARQFATRIIGIQEGNLMFNGQVDDFSLDIARTIYGTQFESAVCTNELKQVAAA